VGVADGWRATLRVFGQRLLTELAGLTGDDQAPAAAVVEAALQPPDVAAPSSGGAGSTRALRFRWVALRGCRTSVDQYPTVALIVALLQLLAVATQLVRCAHGL